MRCVRQSSEDEMIALFLGTELASVRHGPRLRELIDRQGLAEHIVIAPDLTKTPP